MPRVTKQAIIEAQAQEIEALKLELEQSRKDYLQEQAYIKALAKLDFERKDLQAELAKQAQEIEALKLELEAKQDQRKQALAREKNLRADLEGMHSQESQEIEALKQELAQAIKERDHAERAFDKLATAYNQADSKLAKQAQAQAQAKQASFQALASPQEPELEQELAYYKIKLAQAIQEIEALKIEAEQAEHNRLTQLSKLGLEQEQDLAQAEYMTAQAQALALELVQELAQAQAQAQEQAQELRILRLEQAWNNGDSLTIQELAELTRYRRKAKQAQEQAKQEQAQAQAQAQAEIVKLKQELAQAQAEIANGYQE